MPDRGRTERDPEFYEAPTIRPGGPPPDRGSDTVEHPANPRPAAAPPGGPMKPATLAEFKRSLVEVGLLEVPELERFAAEAPGGVLELAHALVQAGKLTPYQASAANQGKTKGLVIGNYFVLGRLGAGGMGVVFKARHRRLGRVVALKILPPSFAKDRDLVLRFRREVDAAARLKHPNVIAAVDADEDRGVHFLAMDYVDGRDLERLVSERGPLPVAQAVDCVIQAARGLEAAHAAGIIHRDIKPGNLMLDGSGTVRVLDLGLARFVEASNPFGQSSGPALTQSGSYMGTVDYMAPEQAEDSRSVDGRADTYSLGCTLYYLLTGKPPFDAPNVLKRLMAHQERPAPSLRVARPDVPEALEEIYQRMMAKRPGDRPGSMAEVVRGLEAGRAPKEASKAQTGLKDLAEDALKRAPSKSSRGRDASIFARHDDSPGLHIDNDLSFEDLVMDFREEVHPAPMPDEEEVQLLRRIKPSHARSGHRKKSRRGKPLVAFGAIGVLALAVAGFLSSRRGGEDVRPVDNAPPPAPRPVAQPEARSIFDGTGPKGWMLCDGKPLPASFVQPDGLNPHGTGSYLTVFEEKLGDFVLDLDYKLPKGGNSGVFLRVGDLADPVPSGLEVQLIDKGGTTVQDCGAFYGLVGPRRNAHEPGGRWNHLKVTAVGPRISLNINGVDVNEIDLDDWKKPGVRPDGTPVTAGKLAPVAFGNLPRSGYLGLQDNGTDCWFKNITIRKADGDARPEPPTLAGPNRSSLVEVARFEGHAHDWVDRLAVAPDGRSLVTACEDGRARQWDIATGRELREFWHPQPTRSAEFLPGGRRLVTTCIDGSVRLWDLSNGAEIRRFVGHKDRIDHGLAVSRDGRRLATGSEDKSVIVWNAETGEPEKTFNGLPASIFSVALSPDGRRLLAGCRDGTIYAIDIGSGYVRFLSGHKAPVWALEFAPDGRHAASGGDDGKVIYWDVEAGRVALQHDGGKQFIRAVRFEPDGRVLRVANQNWNGGHAGELLAWDLQSGKPPAIVPGPLHSNLAFLPGGGLATSDGDGVARIYRSDARLALARDYASKGKTEEALAAYKEEIAERPGDARLRIERGRYLAGLGRDREADADFARAYELSSGNLQLFIDAGAWVAGPYKPDRKAPIGPKPMPNPSPATPPPASDGSPRRWVDLPTRNRGMLPLGELYPGVDSVAYAMFMVYVPENQVRQMMMGADDQAGFWLNDAPSPFLEWMTFSHTDSLYWNIHLRAGRNVILAKVVNTKGNDKWEFSLHLRFPDAPIDQFRMAAFKSTNPGNVILAFDKALARDPSIADPGFFRAGALAFADKERWKDAIGAVERAIALAPDEPSEIDWRRELALIHLGAGDLAGFRDMAGVAIERVVKLKSQDPLLDNNVAWLAALAPDVPHISEALRMAKFALDKRKSSAEMNTYGCLLYRKGDFANAEQYLHMSIKAQKGVGYVHDWAVLAMAQHRQSNPEARKSLDRARELAKTTQGWVSKAEITQILDEAEKVLKGPHKP